MGKKGKKKGGSGGGEGPSGGDGGSGKEQQKVQQPPKHEPKPVVTQPQQPPPAPPSQTVSTQPLPGGVWGRGTPLGGRGGGPGGDSRGQGGGGPVGDNRGRGGGGPAGNNRGRGDYGDRGGGQSSRGGRGEGPAGDNRGRGGGGPGDNRGRGGGGPGDSRGQGGGGPAGDNRGRGGGGQKGRGGGQKGRGGGYEGGQGRDSREGGDPYYSVAAPPSVTPPSVWRPQSAPAPTSDPVSRPQTPGQPMTALVQRGKSDSPVSVPSSSSSSSLSGSSPLRSSDLERKMSDMSLSSMPKRKGTGTYGDQIVIETNHLALKIKDPNMRIYHYDVDIKPDKPFRLYRKVVSEFQRQFYPNNFFGFDGRKNIFTNVPMKNETVGDLLIFDEEKSSDHKGIEYTIVVKYAHDFTLKNLWEYFQSGSSLNPPQLMIQALDVVLRRPANENPRFVSVGRSFFSAPRGNVVQLGGGLNLWYGFYQSAILGWKPFLNVDVAHKGFPEAVNCLDCLAKLTNTDINRELDDTSLQIFRQYIKGLKVIYEIPNQKHSRRTYRITDIAEPPRSKKFIDDRDKNQETTISKYFQQRKNYKLRYDHLPSLQAGPKTANRDCCLPLELCTIMEGQVVNKKLDDKQTATMVRSAARPTFERKQKIMNSIREVNYSSDPCVSQFGISVDSQFAKIEARVMPPPLLRYNQPQMTRVGEGVWTPGKFLNPNNVDNWAIVNLDFRTSVDTLKAIGDSFHNFGASLGMNVSKPEIRVVNIKRYVKDIRPDLQKELDDLQNKNFKLAVVVIPTFGDAYGKVKQVAELRTGILTQCLKAKTVNNNLNRSTVTNILLKLNAKLNGLNHSLKIDETRFNFLNRPIIIFGADVTHPSPDQTDIPSVAAVTASFDKFAFKYNVEWALQGPREEVISTLEDIVEKHLKHFYRSNKGVKPERIVFYRDGVSEGQFSEVLRSEVLAIKRACKKLESEYEPSITFLVVQKRHHTRLFPCNPKDARGKNMNVPAGTVVDQTITHPTEKDFFLNSHASIQGTSRPTKYHVLWDDADLSMDYLQVMTYYLCHLFTRCARSISYPAPTYYAHLAAFRIRAYCEGRSMNLQEFNNQPRLKEMQKKVSEAFPMFYV